MLFQSTPLAGGATPARTFGVATSGFQSTPLAGGATALLGVSEGQIKKFQSTPLAGGATGLVEPRDHAKGISIHAPRGRGDFMCFIDH